MSNTFHKILLGDLLPEINSNTKSMTKIILENRGLTLGIVRKYKFGMLKYLESGDRSDNEIVSFSHIKDPAIYIYNPIIDDARKLCLLIENKNLDSNSIAQMTKISFIVSLKYSLYNADKFNKGLLLRIYNLSDKQILKFLQSFIKYGIDINISWSVILDKFEIKLNEEILDKMKNNRIAFTNILSYNAPMDVIKYLHEKKFEWNWKLLSLNRNITEDFVLENFDNIESEFAQGNTSISLEFIYKHFQMSICKIIILHRLDLTIEDIYKYNLINSLKYQNPAITMNIIREHKLIESKKVKLTIFSNPSLTYEDMNTEEFKSILNENKDMQSTICKLLLENDYEFSNKMIQLNEILEKKRIHASQLFKLLEQYLSMVLCKIIIDYEFYR
jgi:hypothetical protein